MVGTTISYELFGVADAPPFDHIKNMSGGNGLEVILGRKLLLAGR